MAKTVKWLLTGFVLIQLLPYGRSHSAPAVTMEPPWDSKATKDLVRRACYDCHSNETVWPWYANVAPVSWLVQNDVDGGRRHLNFSLWNQPQRHAVDVAEQVRNASMPPSFYLPMHPSAKLTDAERRALVSGWEKTINPRPNSDRDPK